MQKGWIGFSFFDGIGVSQRGQIKPKCAYSLINEGAKSKQQKTKIFQKQKTTYRKSAKNEARRKTPKSCGFVRVINNKIIFQQKMESCAPGLTSWKNYTLMFALLCPPVCMPETVDREIVI